MKKRVVPDKISALKIHMGELLGLLAAANTEDMQKKKMHLDKKRDGYEAYRNILRRTVPKQVPELAEAAAREGQKSFAVFSWSINCLEGLDSLADDFECMLKGMGFETTRVRIDNSDHMMTLYASFL